MLLIVPYGIETRSDGVRYSKKALLIVPYGIETLWRHVWPTAPQAF